MIRQFKAMTAIDPSAIIMPVFEIQLSLKERT